MFRASLFSGLSSRIRHRSTLTEKAWEFLQVEQETGSLRCRVALWDFLGYTIAFFIGYYEVLQETGSKFVPQCNSTQDTYPLSSEASKWPVSVNGLLDLGSGTLSYYHYFKNRDRGSVLRTSTILFIVFYVN